MKAKGVTQKDVLYLSISLFFMVVAWVSFNIYHTWATSKITPLVQTQITPIDPRFDTNTIQQIKTRQQVAPLYQLPKVSPSATVDQSASIPAQLDQITVTPTSIQQQSISKPGQITIPKNQR